ncbi:Protein ICE2 [Spathaspora sp. JA1]|nr:Protein ICE2 [Spathaspora sp. JA1]
MIEPFHTLSKLANGFQPKASYVLSPSFADSASSRPNMITFPDGCTPEDYGLHPITRLGDIDLLCRFEVIQYLEALTVAYDIIIMARRTRYFRWISIIYYSQHFIIPSLLTFFLSYSAANAKVAPHEFKYFNPLAFWKLMLRNATPVFTILEGFCSLLLIQAIGQTINWFTIYKSDSWLIISLIGSGSIITVAIYFLYRIYIFPFPIDIASASLLGSLVTISLGLGLFGIVSGQGSMIESSLLFAYIVRCIYETFPILSENASQTLATLLTQATSNLRNEIPKIPPSILNPISEVVPFLASTLPASFKGIWDFLIMATFKLPFPLFLKLAYRIGVFYAATKIIPNLYQSAAYPSVSPPKTPTPRSRQTSSTSLSRMTNEASESCDTTTTLASSPDPKHLQKRKRSFRLKPPHHQPPSAMIRIIYAYAPCLIIAVYTHLMLSYIGELGTELQLWPIWGESNSSELIIVHPWQFWNWVNMGTTLLLYAVELSGNDVSSKGGNSLTSHWNVE